MTFEELQKCFDVLGVSVDLLFHYSDGNTLSSQANVDKLMERIIACAFGEGFDDKELFADSEQYIIYMRMMR